MLFISSGFTVAAEVEFIEFSDNQYAQNGDGREKQFFEFELEPDPN